MPRTPWTVFPSIDAVAPPITRIPIAKPLLTFVIVLPETVGKPGCSIWIPIAVLLMALAEIWTLEAFAYTPTFVARTIVLLETTLNDRRNTNPAPAWMTLLLMISGELSVAEIARSTRSNVDQETEPDELALNWMPAHGNTDAVLFGAKVIGFAEVPSAFHRPSTKRWTPGSNFTVVPGMIVRVQGALIVTAPVAM